MLIQTGGLASVHRFNIGRVLTLFSMNPCLAINLRVEVAVVDDDRVRAGQVQPRRFGPKFKCNDADSK